MSESIVAILTLIATGLFAWWFLRGDFGGDDKPAEARRHTTSGPDRVLAATEARGSFSDREIVRQGRLLAEEVEEFLASGP